MNKTIYVYKNNVLLNNIPLKTYAEAHKILNLKPNSRICFRYIDTNKLYKKCYLITSKLIDKPVEEDVSL